MQNVDFFRFARVSLFRSKKHSLLFRISKKGSLWFFLLKKNIEEKSQIFDKNHGLAPLQNVDFLDFLRTFLLWPKKHSFLSRVYKNVSFWLFLFKRTDEEKVDILRKTMQQNVDFFVEKK